MATRLIPERTIDAWSAIVISEVEPDAAIWLPTPNAQAKNQPWDLALEAFGPPAKVLAFESKALEAGHRGGKRWPIVTIRWDQLLTLIEVAHVRNIPLSYSVPALTQADVAAWRRRGSPLAANFVSSQLNLAGGSGSFLHWTSWRSSRRGRDEH